MWSTISRPLWQSRQVLSTLKPNINIVSFVSNLFLKASQQKKAHFGIQRGCQTTWSQGGGVALCRIESQIADKDTSLLSFQHTASTLLKEKEWRRRRSLKTNTWFELLIFQWPLSRELIFAMLFDSIMETIVLPRCLTKYFSVSQGSCLKYN